MERAAPSERAGAPRPFTSQGIDGIMGNMSALGISLIVAGLALVCGGLILWPRASQTEEEEKTESRREEKTETSEDAELPPARGSTPKEPDADRKMADLLGRLSEIPDDDPFK